MNRLNYVHNSIELNLLSTININDKILKQKLYSFLRCRKKTQI